MLAESLGLPGFAASCSGFGAGTSVEKGREAPRAAIKQGCSDLGICSEPVLAVALFLPSLGVAGLATVTPG